MKTHDHDFGPFFADKNMVELVDEMAKRYGKTPSEICMGMTINEFNFNVAIMFVSIERERRRMGGPKVDGKTTGGFPFKGFKKQVSEVNMTDKEKTQWEIIRKANKDLNLKRAVT